MKKKPKPKSKTRWHRLLAKLLEELLAPLGISVFTEFPLMSESPKADILLLRKKKARWSSEQAAYLPDGIRDSKAKHILLEFKYTESVSRNAVRQTLCYDNFYKRVRGLKDHEVRTFLVSSKTPNSDTLKKIEYISTDQPGVYRGSNWLTEPIPMLSLNELSDEPHNAFFKFFASRRKVKKSAFDTVKKRGMSSFSRQLRWAVEGLLHFWFGLKGDDMDIELTPEKLAELGKMLEGALIQSLPAEERLAGLGPEERLAGLGPEERLAGLEPERILSVFKPEERLAGLEPEQILSVFKPEERLAGLEPEQILSALSAEEIEAYLKKLKNN